MADKDKNDNVEHKKKMVKKKANDDFEELIDAAQKNKRYLARQAAKIMLIKEYGYKKEQIAEDYPIPETEHILDLVVFRETDRYVDRVLPFIIIELREDGFLLPFDKNQLQKYVHVTKADFGMLYDGENKLCYAKLDPTATEIIQIAEIPIKGKFARTIKKTATEELSAISISLNRLFSELKHEDYAEFEKYLPHILAMKIIDSRSATNYFSSFSDAVPNERAEITDLNTVRKMITETKPSFTFLDWQELEEFVDIPVQQSGYEDDAEEWIDSVQFGRFCYILCNLWDVITNVALEKAIHSILVQHTKDSPAHYKTGEGTFFTPDILINFSLELLYPLGEDMGNNKLLIADPLISFLSVKHFFLHYFQLRESSLDNFVRKHVTTISTHKPNSINQFEMMLPEFNLKVDDSMKVMEGLGMFDHVFSCGPFGMQLTEQAYKKEFGDFGNDSENYRILSMIKHVNPGGKLALVLSSGFLFQPRQKKMRKEIAKKCYIRAIIELPPGTFNRYTGIDAHILLLEKKDNKKMPDKPDSWYSSNYKIFMAQIRGKSKPTYHELTTVEPISVNKVRNNFHQFLATRLEIADIVDPDGDILTYDDWEQDSLGFAVNYNDLGDRWTVKDKTPEIMAYEKMPNPKKLGDVVKSISSSNIQIDRINAQAGLGPDQKGINILRISDLENGFVKSEIKKTIKLPKKYITEIIKKGFLKDNDIIISNQGTIGKTAIYRKDKRQILPSPQLFIIKADKSQVQPEYLFKILNSQLIQDKLKSLTTGAYIPRLSKKNLENIIIPVPSQEEQDKSLQRYMSLKRELTRMKTEISYVEKKLKEFDLNG